MVFCSLRFTSSDDSYDSWCSFRMLETAPQFLWFCCTSCMVDEARVTQRKHWQSNCYVDWVIIAHFVIKMFKFIVREMWDKDWNWNWMIHIPFCSLTVCTAFDLKTWCIIVMIKYYFTCAQLLVTAQKDNFKGNIVELATNRKILESV